MYKNRGSSLSLKKKELKGNYIDDAEDEQRFGVVDIRQSLNRRYVMYREKIFFIGIQCRRISMRNFHIFCMCVCKVRLRLC